MTGEVVAPAVRLMGQVSVVRDQAVAVIGPPRQRAVLAVLALHAGRTVSRAKLFQAVWGENPPRSASGNLYTYVSGVRQILEQHPQQPTVLRTEDDGYRLCVPRESVDVLEFDRLTGLATEAWTGNYPVACLDALHDADELWRGTPLSGVDGPVAEVERLRLERQWLTARLLRAEALLALARPAEAVVDCAALVAEYPLDERTAELYSKGLYQSGQVAEALAELTAIRRRLHDELDTRPGVEITRLYEQMLSGYEEADDNTVNAVGTRQRSRTIPAQLPHQPWGFIGRARELADLFSQSGTVVISGHAGIGKSALALAFAHRSAAEFPDGQLYLGLRGSGPDSPLPVTEVVDYGLSALGVPRDELSDTLEARTARFHSILADRRVLVLLDDVAEADQVRPFLPSSGGSTVMVTSRHRLSALKGVRRLPLGGLDPASAAELLVSGWGTSRAVDAASDDVARLVRRCGLVPLAIRIVAARLVGDSDTPVGEAALRTLTDELGDESKRLTMLSLEDNSTSVRAGFEHARRGLPEEASGLLTRLNRYGVAQFDVGMVASDSTYGDATTAARLGACLDVLVEACLLDDAGQRMYRVPALVRPYLAELAAEH